MQVLSINISKKDPQDKFQMKKLLCIMLFGIQGNLMSQGCCLIAPSSLKASPEQSATAGTKEHKFIDRSDSQIQS